MFQIDIEKRIEASVENNKVVADEYHFFFTFYNLEDILFCGGNRDVN